MNAPEIARRATDSSPLTGESAGARRRFYWGLAAITAVFGLIRFRCLFNDLWLDEIWSLRLLEGLHSPLEILTRVHHDNNHPLNSLFLYLVMPAKADWIYRLLSWAAGTAAIWMAGLIGRRQFRALHGEADRASDAAGLITAMLFGACYVLIHYSSEARGYAPAVLFALVAFYALVRGEERGGNAWPAVYSGACILGLLSHLVMFQFMLGGLAWSLARAWQGRTAGWGAARDFLRWQLVPWLLLGAYDLAFVRQLEIGGGPDNALGDVLGRLAMYSFGVPAAPSTLVALGVLVGVVAAGLALVWRRRVAYRWFYLGAIIVAPALGLAMSGFTLLFPRYFILVAVGALLLGGSALGTLWQRRGGARAFGIMLLMAFIVGNSVHSLRLMRYGRGQYRSALRYVAQRTSSASITMSSDHDDRNSTVMAYYAPVIGSEHRIQYFPQNQLPADGPQWLLLHRLDGEAPPPDPFLIEQQRYRRDAVFLHAALSGWDWYVYRNLKYASDTSGAPSAPPTTH